MSRRFAIAASFALFACQEAGSVDTAALPIVGGQLNTADPSVVAIIQDFGGGRAALCTGSVIAETVVLTAAHCLNGETPLQHFVYFGSDITSDFNGSGDPTFLGTIDVLDFTFDTRFDVNDLYAGHDIGLIRLASPAPTTPLRLNDTPTETLVGQPIRLTGFGRIGGGDADGAGIKREVISTIDQSRAELIEYGSADANTCNGDSGGPNLVTVGGVEVIAGITSFGDLNCSQLGAGTRVDAYQDFIQAFVGGAAAACVADDICENDCAEPDPDCAADPCAEDGACAEACEARDPDCEVPAATNPDGDGTEHVGLQGGCRTGGGASPWLVVVAIFLLGYRRRRR